MFIMKKKISLGSIVLIPVLAFAAPAAPNNLQLEAISSTSVSLSWQDNAADETGVKIYRGDDLIALLPTDSMRFIDTGLIPNTTYKYTIKATDDSEKINMDNVNPTAFLPITLSLINLPGHKDDWIGIYPKGSSNDWDNVVSWTYTNGTKQADKDGMITGVVTLEGIAIGEYEARLFYNNSYTLEGTIPFTIVKENQAYPETTLLEYKHRLTDEAIVKPTVGHPTIDPVYKTKISVINKSDDYITSYPKVQAWNQDMSIIKVGNKLYDANSLNETAITRGLNSDEAYVKICSPNSADFRWSNIDPKKFYVLSNRKKFIEGKIAGDNINCDAVVLDLSEYELALLGPFSEGNIDNNDKYVIFVVKKYNDVSIYMILFDIQKQEIVWKDKKVEDDKWAEKFGMLRPEKLDWVSVSQSGKYIVINKTEAGLYRFDINLENRAKLQMLDWEGKLRNVGQHGDFGFDSDGHEVYVQSVSGQGDKNGIYTFSLENPDELGKRILEGSYSGGHISGRNINRPGWCYVTKQSEGNKDVFALKIDPNAPNTVEYFSQTHMTDHYKYSNGNIREYLMTYGSPSPDGTKMIFNSFWDTSDRLYTVKDKADTFIVEKN